MRLVKFAPARAAEAALRAAHATSRGLCARYVRLALNAGGASIPSGPSGCDYGPVLLSLGFTRVPFSAPQTGDVMVFAAYVGNKHGHVQIYSSRAGRWVSDFLQRTTPPHVAGLAHYPGPIYESLRVPFKVYRWLGAVS